MKYIIIATLFLTQMSLAQTYQEAVDKCTTTFMAGFDSNHPETFETLHTTLFPQLKQCITGLKLPSFRVISIDGKEYSSESLSGKIVLINFWFIACSPCVAEIPSLNDLQKEFGTDEVVLISFARDKKEALEQFKKERSIDFPVVANSEELINDTFKMNFGYPTNLFLNKKGEIFDIISGGPTDEAGLKIAKEEMKKVISEELNKE